MVADADLQVWLDTQTAAAQTEMTPYVRSAKNANVRYRMDVIQRSNGNTVRLSQNGTVSVTADRNIPLTHVALGLRQDGECHVELKLSEDGKDAVTYRFNCMQQK